MKKILALVFLTLGLLLLPLYADAAKLSKEEALVVKQDALQNWFAQDGTMILNPGEVVGPFPGYTKNTAGNDNAILFAAEFYWLLNEHEILDTADSFRFSDTVKALEAHGKTGLYHRNPGRVDRYEAHDNYVGIAAGSSLFNLSYGHDIVQYGQANGWTYNNLNPADTGIEHIRFYRQPGEVAFYKMSSGIQPGVFDFLWFLGSGVVSGFTSADNASGHLLDWLRFKAIDKQCAKETNWMCSATYPVKRFWLWRLKSKTNGVGIEHHFKLYFGGRNPANPLEKLSQGVFY